MNSLQHRVLSVAIVCIMAASAVCVAFAYTLETGDQTHKEIRTTVCSYDEFGNMVLDIDVSTYLSHGYSKGDYVHIKWEKGDMRGLTTENFQGLFTFEAFVNLENNGKVLIGCFCAKLTMAVGDRVTISYIGPSDREKLMPYYFNGKWEERKGLTDEELVNYRCVEYGDIAYGRLYRSSNALPRDTDQFSKIMNEIIKRHDADYLIDTNRDKTTILEYRKSGQLDEENAKWYIDGDRMFAENMSLNILQEKNYAHVFKYIADNDGSYLLFCIYGRDRTGFAMIVLESLMGATLENIVGDYSYSYTCQFGTPVDSTEFQLYRLLVIPMLVGMHDPSLMDDLGKVDFYSYDVSKFDLRHDAESYLIDYLGLTHADVDNIRQHLSTPIK